MEFFLEVPRHHNASSRLTQVSFGDFGEKWDGFPQNLGSLTGAACLASYG